MRNGWMLVSFWGKVGIVCGGISALICLVGLVWTGTSTIAAFGWAHAMKPIVGMVSDERSARVAADSLIIRELRDIGQDVESIGSALNDPAGSVRRRRKLEQTQDRR